jgi:hypothetical protein
VKEKKQRNLRFDVQALIAEAMKASSASECVGIRKLAEGSPIPAKKFASSEFVLGTSNRIFELDLNDGLQLIAKIPFPMAGPAHFTTASEVATMRYARDILQLPVPRVLAWCSKAENTPVKSEFIIMEKVKGVQLHDIWNNLSTDAWFHFMVDFAKMEERMANDAFPVLGSLYFEEDLPSGTCKTSLQLLNEDRVPINDDRYCIGPSVSRSFWRGERAHMNIDRGPCRSPVVSSQESS